MSTHWSKILGCILLVTGTAVGAGMLALPLVTASAGFPISAIALVACWILLTFTALLVLEVNLRFPATANLSTMAADSLGMFGKVVTWISVLLLLYALTAAYITGGSSLLLAGITLISHHTLPNWLSTLVFTIVLGSFVVCGTRSVDYLNRMLISLKGLAFIILLVVLTPHIQANLLWKSFSNMPYIWAALPILATSFGFHVLIPSIRAYVGDQPKTLRFIIITGSSLPLLIYLLWEMVSLGVLPQTGPDSFASVAANHGSIGDFVIALQHYLQETRIGIGVNLFTDVAVTTSFLGVTLSLLDFIADAFRFKKTSVSGRSYASLLTFVPPIIFALFYPKGFIMALGYASICVAVILIIMPALMAWKLRKQHETLRRSLCGNRFILLLTVLLGIAIIALQIASNFGYLAK